MKYQTKVQYIEAEQWTGENTDQIKILMDYNYKEINGEIFYPSILGKLKKLEIGDYLIKRGNHFISQEEDDFLRQYELTK